MGAGAHKAAAFGGWMDAGGGGAGEPGASGDYRKAEGGEAGVNRKGPWTRKLHFWRKHRRLWTVRQRFFHTRAGKGLQSAVYSLAQKFPESKVLERVLFHLLPF